MSGVASLLDYDVKLTGTLDGGRYSQTITVNVPVTSLCPCSKEISDYGAHNQRSIVAISVRPREHVFVDELLRVAEEEASRELYGILKRADEKYVTERAYDNPRFVEDLVRGVAARLAADRGSTASSSRPRTSSRSTIIPRTRGSPGTSDPVGPASAGQGVASG